MEKAGLDGPRMNARLPAAVLWAIAGAGLAVAAGTWYRALRPHEVPAPAIWPVEPVPPSLAPDSLGVLTTRIVGGDLFRLARKPALVAYRQRADTQPARAAAVAPPKPPLSLAGIVGGPPWAALLDGVPGHDASLVVHQGDSVAGLRVRRIAPNGVIVTGMDTTWRLLVKRVWQ